MLTLSYGIQKPETNDRGSDFFPALEDNAQIQNDHFHNGVDSALLPAASITKYSCVIPAASWVSDGGGGNYYFTITTLSTPALPSGISGATSPANDVYYYNIHCKIATTGATKGDVVYLDIERESATSITVRMNNNSDDIIVYFT